jgi:4-hydroxythreonine-4-phosphate dehydrogenase
MKKKIILVFGDPNSINSEIIFKTWKKISTSLKKKVYIIGNFELIESQFKKLNYSLNCVLVKNIYEKQNNKNLKIININLNFSNPFLIKKKESSQFIKKSLTLAHKLALDKNVIGIINCAIDKQLLSKKNIGVTEFLANKCKLKKNYEVMMIYNKKMSVVPITTHINIKKVSSNISKSIIVNKIKMIKFWFNKNLKKNPKIAVLGLNPHNGEMRHNSEETKIIIPAIQKLKKLSVNVDGPLVADTIFVNNFKNYDVVVGMYHDQVLAPFKTLFKFDAINITLGLKYLRMSPDHGTAINLIGKNKADFSSLLACINFIKKF